MTQFDSKTFNPEVFGTYVERVPNTGKNELIKSKAIMIDQNIAGIFKDQVGGNYAVLPFKGLIGKNPQNYDGSTSITANDSESFSQGVIVVGRADAWTEKDFAYDITGGTDFMGNVAEQIADYWWEVDQNTLLAILEGIFKMDGAFGILHTLDISANSGDEAKMGAATLNQAIQQAGGDKKNAYSVVVMHSVTATNLENMNLLENLKYTDEAGIQRDLTLATWNGRLVVIDDSMPVVDGKYTTYLLGEGAIKLTDCGVKVPYEMSRDPQTNGGEDTLYARQRKIFALYGISFTKANMDGLSPTDEELRDGANWEPVNNGKAGSAFKTIDLKAIPIARIISREGNTLGGLTVSCEAGTSGKTVVSVIEELGSGNSYVYSIGGAIPTYGLNVSAYDKWDGSAEIAAQNGDIIIVIEADAEGKALKAGMVSAKVG